MCPPNFVTNNQRQGILWKIHEHGPWRKGVVKGFALQTFPVMLLVYGGTSLRQRNKWWLMQVCGAAWFSHCLSFSMCPVVGFGPWLGLGKPLVEILPPGQLRGFCPLLAWLGSAVLGYGPVLSFGLVGPLLPPVISFVARILPTLACAPLAKSVPRWWIIMS